jgi:hypothetical protein
MVVLKGILCSYNVWQQVSSGLILQSIAFEGDLGGAILGNFFNRVVLLLSNLRNY